jgi:VCBS repeat-containing protein
MEEKMAKVHGKSDTPDLFGLEAQPSEPQRSNSGANGNGHANGKPGNDWKHSGDEGDAGAANDSGNGAADAEASGSRLSFTIDGEPAARITVQEDGAGGLEFTVAVDSDSGYIGDLRGLFFQVSDEALLGGLTVSGADVTDSDAAADAVSDLGNGANVNGGNHGPFDVGVEIGTPGMSGDDIQTTTFFLSHDSVDLTLDMIAGQDFAVRMTSVGATSDGDGGREDSLKLVGTAPTIDDTSTAENDSVTTDEDTPLVGNVLADNGNGPDADPDGDALTVNTTPVSDPEHGTLVLDEDGSFVYTPDENFYGEDKFVYEVFDGNGDTDTATVTIGVTSVNDDPVAEDDPFTIDEDTPLVGNVLADNGNGPDSDPDGDALTVNTTAVNDPEHGTLVLAEDGSFVYTPDENFYGEDKFVYAASDGNGGTDTATATITVNPVNDAPVAETDWMRIIETEGAGYIGSLDVVANDHDVDNANADLFVSAINGTAVQPGDWVDLGYGAFVSLEADGRTVSYEDPEYNGPFDFTYTVSDGAGGEATTLVGLGFTDDPLIG